MIFSRLGRILIQAFYFVLVARMLGISAFGAFASVIAIASIAAPFASGGRMQLMLRNVSQRGLPVSEQLTTSIVATVLTSTVLSAAISALARILAPHGISIVTVVLILASDLVLSRVVETLGTAFQSVYRMRETAYVTLIFQAARLAAAGFYFIRFHDVGLNAWVWAYFWSSMVGTACGAAYTFAQLGVTRPDWSRYRADLRVGHQYTVGLAAQTIYNDIDKAMLGRLSTTASAGLYTAAYRVVDIAYMPVRAVMGAIAPRLFEAGARGIGSTTKVAWRVGPAALAYSVCVAFVIVAGAGALPLLLGSSFAASVVALRWLAILAPIKCVQYLLSDSLTGAGLQSARSWAQSLTAILNIVLNLLLIPRFSWRAAVGTSIACDLLLTVAVGAIVRRALAEERSGRSSNAHEGLSTGAPSS